MSDIIRSYSVIPFHLFSELGIHVWYIIWTCIFLLTIPNARGGGGLWKYNCGVCPGTFKKMGDTTPQKGVLYAVTNPPKKCVGRGSYVRTQPEKGVLEMGTTEERWVLRTGLVKREGLRNWCYTLWGSWSLFINYLYFFLSTWSTGWGVL